MRAWIRDKDRPLAEYLIARGEIEANDRTAIETLVASNLKKHGGSASKSLAAIPAAPSTWKCLAQPAAGEKDLETTVAYLSSAATKQRRESKTPRPTPGTRITTVGARPPAMANGSGSSALTLVAAWARCLVALDTELHREVALKQILDAHADDPVSRQRFLLEAEVTGGLEHPGIVPVYGLGTHAGGRPYYAMRFIRGDSLKEAIDAFHARPAGSARRSSFASSCGGSSTCATRSITPTAAACCTATSSRPISCWAGTARRWSSTGGWPRRPAGRIPVTGERTLRAERDQRQRRDAAGTAMGSPAYMSPEQADGRLDRLGPPSDVYSLGATLYCILTGAPPFAGSRRPKCSGASRRGTSGPPAP